MQPKKEYNGMYLGIVVQNNDPKSRGRVKVYVPHVTPNVYENWYSKRDHKKFKFVGANLDSDLTDIIEPLKEILPWAESAQPLIGASGSGRYHAFTKTGSISDTNKSTLFTPTTGETTPGSINLDNIGESPGGKYEYKKYRLTDAFSTYANNTNRLNKAAHEYIPGTYSNSAKGTFSIPNVGSHIWCFFQNGDPLNPVYFAVSFGQEDWHGIYGVDDQTPGIDYPGNYENLSSEDTPARDPSTDTYRNKFVFNQKAGAIEFINTDNKEVLKFTHYSGSFKEFNNFTTTELATGNSQTLILEDMFRTVQGHQSTYIGRDSDNIIRGDRYKKIGSQNRDYFNEWKRIVRPIADLKQLFETQRTEAQIGILQSKTSSKQSKSGTPVPCPVCTSSYETVRYKGDIIVGVSTVRSSQSEPPLYSKISSLGGGVLTSSGTPGTLLDSTCPVCNGKGTSPSSMSGTWNVDTNKAKITELLPEVVEQLLDVESKMGLGGSEIIDIAKDKVETIGLAMNDFSSFRVDTKGKLYNSKMIVSKGGTVPGKTESPLLEYVHVDDLPGGSYTLNVCNKFNCQVGSGGIKMRTFGPVEISGSITNIAGEQVNIASEYEVNIDGGKRLSIVADILQIRQRKGEQVLVDSNLGVNGNIIIGGGLHVEGEISCHHITAPVEIQETENTKLYAKPVSGKRIGTAIGKGDDGKPVSIPVYGTGAVDDSVLCYDHSHHFKNVPLHLKQSNDNLREYASVNMSTTLNIASPPEKTNASGKIK